MLIREITVEDAPQFIQLCKLIDESGYMLFEPGERTTTIEEQENTIKRILADAQSIIYVALVDNKLVGYIAALGGARKRNRHCAYLVLGVLEQYQKQGIATSLFERIFKWTKKASISRLELTVIKDNIKAINLYKRMGFTIEGEKVHSLILDGKPVNEYYLYKLV